MRRTALRKGEIVEFLVMAYDGKDSEAGERRLRARPAHLDNMAVLRAAGVFINGGAILDDHGTMIGSTLYMNFESRAALDQWLQSDPYVTGGVWVDIEVKPIRLVRST
jgi:uncharacterized protein YciI